MADLLGLEKRLRNQINAKFGFLRRQIDLLFKVLGMAPSVKLEPHQVKTALSLAQKYAFGRQLDSSEKTLLFALLAYADEETVQPNPDTFTLLYRAARRMLHEAKPSEKPVVRPLVEKHRSLAIWLLQEEGKPILEILKEEDSSLFERLSAIVNNVRDLERTLMSKEGVEHLLRSALSALEENEGDIALQYARTAVAQLEALQKYEKLRNKEDAL